MPRILALDDEGGILELIDGFFPAGSVQIELVQSGQTPEFYRVLLEQHHPELVITDWTGIGEAVLEAVETLDSRPPVVVFTSEPEVAMRSPRANLVSVFVEKPPASWAEFARQVLDLAPGGSP